VPLLQGVAGAVALLLLWQAVVGLLAPAHGTVPSPLAIARQVRSDGLALYGQAALHTLRPAALGWLWGNGLALALAMLALVWPPLLRPLAQLGVIAFCLPVIAIGPVLTILFAGDTPRVVLAAIPAFYVTLVGALSGLRAAQPAMIDLVRAAGGRAGDVLLKVRLTAALPSLFASLAVAAPSSVLGAIVGEFFGAENGLGVLLINAQQGLHFARTWAVAIVCTLLAGLAYGTIVTAAHRLTPWSRESPIGPGGLEIARAPQRFAVPRALGAALVSFLLPLLAWWALLRLFGVSPFIGKGPLEVWSYVTDPQGGAATRGVLAAEALVSIRDGCIGLAVGSLAGIVAASAFTSFPLIERLLIGPALALQSVPLVAIVPLIVLVFGRNLGSIVVIGSIIAFFPTLATVGLALKRTPAQALDLLAVYGGSRLQRLWKVQLPFALPALLAALRIAAPLAMTGALLAEWLATGNGLGYGILGAMVASDYDGLWARVVLVTLFSLALYRLVGVAEWLAARRMVSA